MARKTTRSDKTNQQPGAEEIRIKETPEKEDFFRSKNDPYVLPPELHMTVKDGFRFGLGFVLALVLFYIVVVIGIVLLVKFGHLVNV